MTDKDYSLLRPFDPEAAKDGAELCDREGCVIYDFLGVGENFDGSEAAGVRIKSFPYTYVFFPPLNALRLAPLCWVEGKPVYPGDVLWQTTLSGDVLKRKAKQISADGSYLEFEETGSWAMDGSVSKLSWIEPPPKPVKRWINVYPNTGYDTKAAADQVAAIGRIACIEIELPPQPAK